MKKSLITILIIVILAGLGYFAYTQGLINFDFLKKAGIETKNEVANKNDSLNINKVVVSGGYEEGSKIDQSTIKPWYENNSGYAGSYKYGFSEGENSIEINFKNNTFTATNKSSVYNDASNQFDELNVSFNEVKIVGNKFYSKEFNGEFVNFLYNNQTMKGLRLYGYASRFSKTNEIVDEIGFYGPLINVQVKKSEVPTQPDTTITTTYMCEGRVKIVKEQEAPSLPPRVSYIRERDNADIAYYGDMGAYIRPEYFSIDRKQIEIGYGFNETNFCQYLKN